jgi:hypothetical protein
MSLPVNRALSQAARTFSTLVARNEPHDQVREIAIKREEASALTERMRSLLAAKMQQVHENAHHTRVPTILYTEGGEDGTLLRGDNYPVGFGDGMIRMASISGAALAHLEKEAGILSNIGDSLTTGAWKARKAISDAFAHKPSAIMPKAPRARAAVNTLTQKAPVTPSLSAAAPKATAIVKGHDPNAVPMPWRQPGVSPNMVRNTSAGQSARLPSYSRPVGGVSQSPSGMADAGRQASFSPAITPSRTTVGISQTPNRVGSGGATSPAVPKQQAITKVTPQAPTTPGATSPAIPNAQAQGPTAATSKGTTTKPLDAANQAAPAAAQAEAAAGQAPAATEEGFLAKHLRLAREDLGDGKWMKKIPTALMLGAGGYGVYRGIKGVANWMGQEKQPEVYNEGSAMPAAGINQYGAPDRSVPFQG